VGNKSTEIPKVMLIAAFSQKKQKSLVFCSAFSTFATDFLITPLSVFRVSAEWTDKTTALGQGWHSSKGYV